MKFRRRRALLLALALAPLAGRAELPAIVPPADRIADETARRALALSLAWSGASAEARPLLENLLAAAPGDAELRRALDDLTAGLPGAAERRLAALRARIAADPADVTARVELAELELGLGHASAARTLFAEARRIQKPVTGDAFDLRHARARRQWGDLYGAETSFRAALAAAPADAGLREELLLLLKAQDRHEEVAALELRRGALPPAAAAAPDELALAFRTAGPEGTREPEFLRAYTGDADRWQAAGEPLPEGVTVPASAARLNQLAGLYAGQGDFELAIRALRAARLADPEHFDSRLGLAEFLAIAGHYDEAHREFATLAAEFPDSRQVLLKQARALGWGRRYGESIAAYAVLRQQQPSDPVMLLEQGRVAGWAKRRGLAAELYAQSWAAPVDLRLVERLRPILGPLDVEPPSEPLAGWQKRAEVGVRDHERDYHEEDAPFGLTELFEADLPALRAQVPPETAAALDALRAELHADFLVQRALWLENRAKQLAWDRRWWRSEETYDRLLAVTPGNQEALFDLSQVQAAQGLGQRERATLGRLLALDANNRLATAALFRRERRSEPLVFGQYDFYRERGRDELSSIRRQRITYGGETMLDDRFRLRGALVRWREAPYTTNDVFRARGFTVGADGVFDNWLTASADYTHKDDLGPGIGDVDTGALQAWAPFRDAVRVGAGYEVREELANEFAYFQGIRSERRWLGAEVAFSRRAEVTARAEFIDYADDNRGNHVWIAPAYTWSEHPRTFKTILTLEARDTEQANVYQFAGGNLVDITHPYWTPQDYQGAALTLEWRHDLATDFFIGAQEHWYDIRATFGASNDDNRGVSWAADYAAEWRDRWVLRLGVAQTFSRQWDDLRAHARLAFRF